MKSILSLFIRSIGYNLFRTFGKPVLYPFNLTISVAGTCNSKCKTCHVWKDNADTLTSNQWSEVLESVGKSPLWITIAGGEPFLREDLVEIARSVSKFNQPNIMTIATNGVLTDKIERDVKEILSFFKGKLIINLSIDAVGDDHDEIRGLKCFDMVMETYRRLKKIDNLNVGIHTVISKYNIDKMKDISKMVKELKPDSFIYQIAENRSELKNLNMDIAPDIKEYLQATDFLESNSVRAKGISRLTQILRKKYHKIVKRILLENKSPIPCYAGIASGHIAQNGDLWMCGYKSETIGNLMEKSFIELWNSKEAKKARAKIKKQKCYCTMANVSYSNMMCDPLCIFL